MCNASGLPVTIFRPHNIFGPRMGMAHVVPELLKKAYSSTDNAGLEVFSAEHKRTFCYIDDAVKILFLAARSEDCLGQTINLGNQEEFIILYSKLTLKNQKRSMVSPSIQTRIIEKMPLSIISTCRTQSFHL